MLTVLIATRNRAPLLARCLERLAVLATPPGGWKVLIGDAGSTDETPAVIGRHAPHLPLETVLCAPGGKNAALNALVARAEGDLAVFCDDDILVEADWLLRHRELADRHPGFGVFAGPIAPAWDANPPAWVLDSVPLSVAYALTPDQDAEGPCPPDRVWGGNMSVRTRFFAEGFRFDPKVGPDSGTSEYRMGGETELITRLWRRGAQCYFSRAPRVRHIIRAEQLDEDWIIARAFKYGRQVGARYQAEGGARGLLGPAWWELKAKAIGLAGAACGGSRAAALRSAWARSFSRGVSYEAARK